MVLDSYRKCRCKCHNRIENRGLGRINRDIIGVGNSIVVKQGTRLANLRIRIRGNNNTLVIGQDCTIGSECSFWMEGNNISIEIGSHSSFTLRCHLNAQEDNTMITIGEDCMFSNQVIVRTSDSHPIYDMATLLRLNKPQNVVIGNHVWIAPNTKIMKGSVIGDGCIIGSDTTTNKTYPANSLIVGRPAMVVKSNVTWSRELLF